jgi:GNAT superfamily N-acetyltransferase
MASDGADPPGRAGSWWQCVVRGDDGELDRLVVVASTRYPDDARIELSEDMAAVQIGDRASGTARFGTDSRVDRLEVAPRVAPAAPPTWFAELRESTAQPPAVNLLAFTGHGQPAGTLVDGTALAELPVVSRDQLAAVRWYPSTGEVDQVYVQPAWRRHGLATVLIMAAKTLCAAREWPRLWGDGQRTALGEQLRNASLWRHRAADLTHVAPPMTPDGALETPESER